MKNEFFFLLIDGTPICVTLVKNLFHKFFRIVNSESPNLTVSHTSHPPVKDMTHILHTK